MLFPNDFFFRRRSSGGGPHSVFHCSAGFPSNVSIRRAPRFPCFTVFNASKFEFYLEGTGNSTCSPPEGIAMRFCLSPSFSLLVILYALRSSLLLVFLSFFPRCLF